MYIIIILFLLFFFILRENFSYFDYKCKDGEYYNSQLKLCCSNNSNNYGNKY